MPLNYIQGDLLQARVDVIAHGCNCQQTMGAGIAKYISQVYPEVRRADRHFQSQKAKDRLGKIDIVKVHEIPDRHIKYVVNCYTQLTIGHGLQISYRAIHDCMIALHNFVVSENLSLGIPKIGAGLGGGDWKTVAQDIENVFGNREVSVYYLR